MLKLVLIALFGAVAGQAVVWYTGQFYALFFLEKILRVDGATANIMIAIALVIGTPFFLFFGWLSDRIGRKKIILAGCLIAAVTYFPLFNALSKAANPALYAAQASAPVTVIADPRTARFNSIRSARTSSTSKSCDIAKAFLAKAGVSYAEEAPLPEKPRAYALERTCSTFPIRASSRDRNAPLRSRHSRPPPQTN